jgi:hypothetical protein
VEWPHRRGRIAGQGTANWTSAAESHAAAAVIVRVPQGIVNWDDSVECAKTDVIDRASPVRQRFRRVQ